VSARRRAPLRPPATRRAASPEPPARALSDARELKKLTALMEESGLVELEIESGGEKVRLVRGRVVEPASMTSPPQTRAARREADADAGARAITAPMVGTFHRAVAPETAAFVEVGDVVERGQVLCLIEAMKMMNEIEAEFRGRVVTIVVDNGRPVEYGEPLFLIEPV
jgi:acetyl-CoA carboxylase biotin carboxyl carrier protein